VEPFQRLHFRVQGTGAHSAIPGDNQACRIPLRELAQADESSLAYLRRHLAGDSGDLDAEDRQENEMSLANGLRLLSPYALQNGTRLLIATEADRSATTLLLPEEY
jgi:hypothetical protein